MKEQLLSTLENSKKYTMSVAEAMPENEYEFKPVETVWSFRELMDHVAYGIAWWSAHYIKGIEPPWSPGEAKADKKQVKKYLENAYAALKDIMAKSKFTDKEVNGFYATLDHITHHRGQAVTYLRCKEINPPEYMY